MKLNYFLFVLVVVGVVVFVNVVDIYSIDFSYIYFSFEVDYMGVFIWCGKFDKISGIVILDCVVKIGIVDIIIDIVFIDFGMVKMNDYVKSVDMFDVVKYLIV